MGEVDPKSGMLSNKAMEITAEERSLFSKLLSVTRNTYVYEYLDYIFADNLFFYLDLFAGETIRVPSREETFKYVEYAQIYIFYNKFSDKDVALHETAQRFKRRTQSINRIISKVEECIERRGSI